MSAYLVSQDHVNALMNYGAQNIPPVDVSMFQTLVDENMRSLQYRYSNVADWAQDAEAYAFECVDVLELIKAAMNGQRVPLALMGNGGGQKYKPGSEAHAKNLATAIVKLCDCYDYQASESPDYPETKASRFIDRIRNHAMSKGGKASGPTYDVMPWGI